MGEADRRYGHKPLSLQRCTKSGSPKLISCHATRDGTFTPRWSPLLPSVGIFPVPLEAAPQVPQAALGSRVWPGPLVPCSRGVELGLARADGSHPHSSGQRHAQGGLRQPWG